MSPVPRVAVCIVAALCACTSERQVNAGESASASALTADQICRSAATEAQSVAAAHLTTVGRVRRRHGATFPVIEFAPELRRQTVGVGKDWRRQLRSKLATGGGAEIVAALTVVDDVGSQLAGDALLLALATEVAGAAPIAERCATGLRSRGWEGDEELALQLDAARGATPPTDLTEIPADLELLADVLHGGLDAAGGRLDLSSGEV